MDTPDIIINQTDELEAQRAQVAEFKSRLDRQEIVNDRLLRDVVRGKFKSLKRFNIYMYITALVGFLVIIAAFALAGVSLWPAIVLGLLGVFEAVFTWWNLGKISGVSEMSVVDAQTAITGYVRREKWLNILEIIPVVAIIVWACYAVDQVGVPDGVPEAAIEGGITGGIIGLVIGVALVVYLFTRHFRMIRNLRKSIDALKNP